MTLGRRNRLRDPVQIINSTDGVEDERGNIPPAVETVAYERARIRPLSTDEYTIASDTIVSRWRATFVADTAATELSEIVWDGQRLKVDGEVQLSKDLQGRPVYRYAVLRRIKG